MIKILLQIKNKFKREEEKKEEAPAALEPSAESKLLAEIRDILK